MDSKNDPALEKRELMKQKDDLILQKKEIETRLLMLKNKVRSSGRLPNHTYRIYCQTQNGYIRDILWIENKLAALKPRLRELNDAEWNHRRLSPIAGFMLPSETRSAS